MNYSVFILIAQDPDGDTVTLIFDSEFEARRRYERLAKLGKAELIHLVRNPNARIEGATYYARNFSVEPL